MLASALVLLAVPALAAVTSGAAKADDDRPTPEERARIEAALRQIGFETWGEIEREDGGRVWEVENAHDRDGRRWERKVAADDLREISCKPEN